MGSVPVLIVENQKMAKFLTSFLFLTSALFGNVVEEGIRHVSLHDRACMKAFFQHAIQHDQAAHVLYCDNKPACLIATVIKHKNKPFNEVLCLKGWRAFKKHEHLFPHPQFMFSENIVEFDDAFKVLHVYIIKKESLEKCLEAHSDLFQTTLGPQFSTEQFIARLEQGEALHSLLQGNEMLLGVVLGFGRESSHAYISPKDNPQYGSVILKQPRGCSLEPVVFMGNSDSFEVQQLTTEYEKELEQIWHRYRNSKNHLKMILERLCSEEQP